MLLPYSHGAVLTGDHLSIHAAVYCILFDSGKSDIKPESAQAVVAVAKILKAEPGVKVFVVGHTDSVGSTEANLKLSQVRGGRRTAASNW